MIEMSRTIFVVVDGKADVVHRPGWMHQSDLNVKPSLRCRRFCIAVKAPPKDLAESAETSARLVNYPISD